MFDEKWPNINTVGRVISYRKSKNKEQLHYRYYISSAKLTAEEIADAVRKHWAVENQLHRVLDITMKEDSCQIYRNNGADNLARIRQAKVNILKKEPSKISIKRNKMACLNGFRVFRKTDKCLKKAHALALMTKARASLVNRLSRKLLSYSLGCLFNKEDGQPATQLSKILA